MDSQRASSNVYGRKKEWRPKVRTGCLTCRQRRVKCDEARPNCFRCLKAGRSCEGYGLPNCHVLQATGENATEKRAYQFFYEKAVPELADYFDAPFWNRFVMRLSRAYPAVKHSVLAIGAAYEAVLQRKGILDNNELCSPKTFCLHEVNKAIGELVKLPEKNSMPVVLICSVLFYHLGFLMPGTGTLVHLDQGLRIAREYQDSSSRWKLHPGEFELVENHLIPRMKRLGASLGSVLDPAYAVSQSFTTRSMQNVFEKDFQKPELQDHFESLNQAKDCLMAILHWVLGSIYRRVRMDIYTPGEQHEPTVLVSFRKWLAATDLFVQISGSRGLKPALAQGASLLKIYGCYTLMICRCINIKNETTFDKCNDIFRDLVSFCAEFFTLRLPGAHDAAPKFSAELSVLKPLQFTALKCREPSIRHKALSMLLGTAREEGGLGARESGLILQGVIDIEQRGIEQIASCYDIPEPMRICVQSIGFHYTPKSEILVCRFTRFPYDTSAGATEEVAFIHMSETGIEPQHLTGIEYAQPGHENDYQPFCFFHRNTVTFNNNEGEDTASISFNASTMPFLPHNLRF